jgi:hypothetical protein
MERGFSGVWLVAETAEFGSLLCEDWTETWEGLFWYWLLWLRIEKLP